MYQVITVFFLAFVALSGASVDGSAELNTENLMLVPDINGSLSDGILPKFNADKDVKFLLYTRRNQETPQVVNIDPKAKNPIKFGSKPIKFLIHGFLNYGSSPVNKIVKKALFDAGEEFVIVVDWGKGANFPYEYLLARTHVPKVGEQVAKFMIHLRDKKCIAGYNQISIIGHSLGAHVAGFAGKHLYSKKKQKVNVIFGLDPAGPKYSVDKPTRRLNKADATRVIVLHTNGGSGKTGYFGMFSPIGHVDFYPNGGVLQPGCRVPTQCQCSHNRAYKLFAVAVTSNQFVAKKCRNQNEASKGACSGSEMIFTGKVGGNSNADGIYYFKTGEEFPYKLK